jgi:choline kinase
MTHAAKAPETAVILVAGLGSRLNGHSADHPKCLAEVGDRPILDWQLAGLHEAGVRRAVFVVGFQADLVRESARELATGYGIESQFVENPRFAGTQTGVSMACAAEALEGGAYTLNGDVVFAPPLLRELSEADGEAIVVVDPHPCGAEEVKVVLDPGGRVIGMGKWVTPSDAAGEFIGIARFGRESGRQFARSLRERSGLQTWQLKYYDDTLHDLAASMGLHGLRLGHHPMVEVDFPQDLHRARELFSSGG